MIPGFDQVPAAWFRRGPPLVRHLGQVERYVKALARGEGMPSFEQRVRPPPVQGLRLRRETAGNSVAPTWDVGGC